MLIIKRRKNLEIDRAAGVYEILANNRIIDLMGEINWFAGPFSALTMRADLLVLASQSKEPIKLRIFSPGGIINAGKMLYRTIIMLNPTVPIYTVGYECESMAAVILAAGKKGHRYITPYGRVMIHSARVYSQQGIRQKDFSLIEKMDKELIDILAQTCGISERQKEELYETVAKKGLDKWLDAEKAVEFGIVDHIIDPESNLYEELFGGLIIPRHPEEKPRKG